MSTCLRRADGISSECSDGAGIGIDREHGAGSIGVTTRQASVAAPDFEHTTSAQIREQLMEGGRFVAFRIESHMDR